MRPYHVTGLLLTSALLTASAVAATPKTDAAPSAAPLRVSSGIVAPVIMEPIGFYIPPSVLGYSPANSKVVLTLSVDEKGNAQNVRVVQSASPELDSHVVTAVLQSHFRPATLNKQPIPIDMSLTVNVNR
jgi:TonB family protein